MLPILEILSVNPVVVAAGIVPIPVLVISLAAAPPNAGCTKLDRSALPVPSVKASAPSFVPVY